ncbi:MAG: DUF3291 domain-containing protein [Rhodobacteraceae bacterium]|nr:DUF3291 domain-containing protein [Paracoccaceae bacterium]
MPQLSGFNIAQMNYGRLLYDWEDPRVADFVNGLETVYAIAARSPGFVWMMPADDMEAEQLDPKGVFCGDPRIASTLTVWDTVESLRAFVYDTLHGRFLQRGREWFEAPETPNFVMWPVAPEHRPTMTEAMARLRRLTEAGPGPSAFDWKWAAQNSQRISG